MNPLPPDTLFWLAAIHSPAIKPKKFRHCLEFFSDIKKVFSASEQELKQAGLNANEINVIKSRDWHAIEKELQWCELSQCQVIVYDDERYPQRLKEIDDAPLLLFVRGNSELLSKPQIAIVGSRNPTVTSAETASDFARHLANAGLVITSGLAIGIDTASHKGALLFGETVAVMGAGFRHIYPSSNRKLADEIIDKGALISEFVPSEEPKAKNFPRRNRIISGLSLGVLVVEAALKSGSLITARFAAEQGREVFAIPGSIHNPLARGCHYLIKQGAKLVETAEDIVEEFRPFLEFASVPSPNISQCKTSEMTEKQRQILAKIGFEATGVDTIIARSGLTAAEVSSILLSLELESYVQTVPGGYTRSTSKTA